MAEAPNEKPNERNPGQADEESYEETDGKFKLPLKRYRKTDDLTEKQREDLMKQIGCLEGKLKEKIKVFKAAQNDVNRKNEIFLKDLENGRNKMKNEIEIQFDKMKKEGEDQMKEVTTSLKNEISALNELLSSIKYNAEEGHYNDKVGRSTTDYKSEVFWQQNVQIP